METVWGLNTPGAKRGELLFKLADLIEQNKEELAAIEALDNGKRSHAILSEARQGLTDTCRESIHDSSSCRHSDMC